MTSYFYVTDIRELQKSMFRYKRGKLNIFTTLAISTMIAR